MKARTTGYLSCLVLFRLRNNTQWNMRNVCEIVILFCTSMALEVEGTDPELTAASSSTDRLVDASVLLKSFWGIELRNCFPDGKGNLLLLPPVMTCPLRFLQSPTEFSYAKIPYHIFNYCQRQSYSGVCIIQTRICVLLCSI